jgi:ribosomal-protein-alanine N-acetyltransferase
MEKMPFQPEADARASRVSTSTSRPAVNDHVTTDWRQGLPTLVGKQVVLRELHVSDAASLFALLTTEEVARFISPPPTTVEGFEQFIAWTIRQRKAGSYACFAVTIQGCDTAIGIFQVREMERGFGTAEWGFALGSPYWGTGVFQDSAEIVLEFVFGTLRVHRLEARAAVLNGRGIGALRKIGAVKEGVLRKSLERHGQFLDQVLYAVLDSDWHDARASRFVAPPHVH